MVRIRGKVKDMKIKPEQKEVLKSVSKKMGEKLVQDVKETKGESLKRPLVVMVLVVAAVGILRDPTTILIGALAATLTLAVLSTSTEDIKKFVNSLGKAEEKKAEDKKEEAKQELPEEKK